MSQQRMQQIYAQKAAMNGGYSLGGMHIPPLDQLVAHYLQEQGMVGEGFKGQLCKTKYESGPKKGYCKEYYSRKELNALPARSKVLKRAKEAGYVRNPPPRGQRASPKQKAAAKNNPWLLFLAEYQAQNPQWTRKELLTEPQLKVTKRDYHSWQGSVEKPKKKIARRKPVAAKTSSPSMAALVREGKKKSR